MSRRSRHSRVYIARQLRREATPTEIKIWSVVRRKQLFGLKFRRQHPIGPFIVDFYCPKLKLVLETEGGVHSWPQRTAVDRARADHLRSMGLKVVRVLNEDATEENLRHLISEFISGPSGR